MKDVLLALRRYADFSGRSRRREYWHFVLFQWLIFGPLGGAFLATGGDLGMLAEHPFTFQHGGLNAALMVIGWAMVAVLAIPLFSVEVRRLHDRNWTGWLVLLGFVPLGAIPLLVLMCLDGTAGANRFGPDPKRRDPLSGGDWRDAPADPAAFPPRPGLGGRPIR